MNTRAHTLASAVAVLLSVSLSVSLSACADLKMTQVGPVPEVKIAVAPNPDAVLADAVRAELTKMHAKDVKVAVKGGEVTLTGSVKDGQQLGDIAMAVQKMSGVKAVIPDVDVKS